MQVAEVARPHNVPIIGQGGICSADDALEFIIAGATTVGVGTALFYEPHSCKRINDGIAAYLVANRMESVSALIGSLDAPKKSVQACAC
jgi:dihydroorotate dehydrogenase (NAD+) catalytic subunit